MTDQFTTPNDPEQPPAVAGVLAAFDGPESLRAAAARVREAGFARWDAHSPFPVHGMERAMGIRPTPLPWVALGGGILGAAGALLMQWWMNAVNYPIVISGKPLFSLPANIPITFELIVLLSAFGAFGSVLVLNLLPQFWHWVFSGRAFQQATTDGFFISIEATDPKFDAAETPKFLESLRPLAVELCYDTAGRCELPSALYWSVAVLVVLSLLPPLLIARYRAVPKSLPRIHPILDMDLQPKYLPQGASPLFADGRAMRPPVPGTIAQGQLGRQDDHFYRGQRWRQMGNHVPHAGDIGPDGARPRAVQRLLCRLSRIDGRRRREQRHLGPGDPPRRQGMGAALVAARADDPPAAGGRNLQHDHQRHSHHARLRLANPRGRPLGHHSVRAGATAEPERDD